MQKKPLTIIAFALISLALMGCQSSTTSQKAEKNTKQKVSSAEESTTGEETSTVILDSSEFENLEPVELIGADSTGKGTAGQMFGELVAENVSAITNGKFTIEYHPNGEYGQDQQLLESMEENEIQLVVCQPGSMVDTVPDLAVFDMPMVFSRYDGKTIDIALNNKDLLFYEKLEEDYNKAGLHLLGFLQNATYRLTTSNKPLRKISDFKDLKIRTMDNENHLDFWKALGCQPEAMEWGQVPLALKSGAIEAQENAADTIIGAYLNEVQKYLECTNHILYTNQICMNKEAYDSLDPAYQAALDQAVEEAIASMRIELETIDRQNKKLLEENGMEIITYNDNFFNTIQDLVAIQTLNTNIDIETDGLGSILRDVLKDVKRGCREIDNLNYK